MTFRLALLTLGMAAGALGATARRNAAPSVQPDTTLVLRASGSTLEFLPARLSARSGTHVRIRFVNDGTLPHNVVVPKNDDDLDALATAAYNAGATGFVPLGDTAKLVVYTKLVSPGETAELSFVMPAPGEYRYVCLFPGHANSMLGTLRSLR
ncbi:MAG TPA: plastocyanin/azurin family copper-binding protein [Gemmatimonadaceae bacterium]|jgi:plastocyanin